MESFITKNGLEQIKISNEQFRGHDFVDVRQYVYGSPDELIPTPKGVTFPYDKLQEVIVALKKLAKHLNA